MRRRCLVSMMALLVEAGWVLADSPPPSPAKAGPPAASRAATAADATCGGDGCAAAPCVAPGCNEDTDYLWVRGEYLLWHIKNPHLMQLSSINTMPLVNPTTGAAVNFAFTNTVIFPQGMQFDDAERSGGRITIGAWLDPEKDCGIEASYFQLERKSVDALAQQVNSLTVNTPFFALIQQTVPGAPAPVTTAVPSSLSGTLAVDAHAHSSSRAWGTEANARTRLWYFGNAAFDVLGGARYVDFHESVLYTNNVTFIPDLPAIVIGTQPVRVDPIAYTSLDFLNARNQFYGPQVGASMDWECGHVFLTTEYKVALGEMHQSVDALGSINGAPGGILLAPGDNGQHTRDHYSFVQEVTTNLGYRFTPNLRGFVGYNFLWLQNVARPGDQIGVSETHTTANFGGTTTQLDVRQPEFKFTDASVWMQGVNFGVEWRY